MTEENNTVTNTLETLSDFPQLSLHHELQIRRVVGLDYHNVINNLRVEILNNLKGHKKALHDIHVNIPSLEYMVEWFGLELVHYYSPRLLKENPKQFFEEVKRIRKELHTWVNLWSGRFNLKFYRKNIKPRILVTPTRDIDMLFTPDYLAAVAVDEAYGKLEQQLQPLMLAAKTLAIYLHVTAIIQWQISSYKYALKLPVDFGWIVREHLIKHYKITPEHIPLTGSLDDDFTNILNIFTKHNGGESARKAMQMYMSLIVLRGEKEYDTFSPLVLPTADMSTTVTVSNLVPEGICHDAEGM